ncbi:MAG TPA: TspO/MBR family protein [Longimicrobium sp.]|nr:TspO/MBR family protein [Longimicrobium sp.]
MAREDGRGGGALLALAGFAAAVGFAAALGSRNDPRTGDTKEWYRALDKPRWTPPEWVFPIAWTPLYALIALSAYRVWRAEPGDDRSRALALWGAQLGLNAAWTPLFFGRQSPEAGLADVALMVPAIGAYMAQARRVDPPAAWMLAPYLAWGTFAAALNADIVRRRMQSSDGEPDGADARTAADPAPRREVADAVSAR